MLLFLVVCYPNNQKTFYAEGEKPLNCNNTSGLEMVLINIKNKINIKFYTHQRTDRFTTFKIKDVLVNNDIKKLYIVYQSLNVLPHKLNY